MALAEACSQQLYFDIATSPALLSPKSPEVRPDGRGLWRSTMNLIKGNGMVARAADRYLLTSPVYVRKLKPGLLSAGSALQCEQSWVRCPRLMGFSQIYLSSWNECPSLYTRVFLVSVACI